MRVRKFKAYDKETGDIALLSGINFKNGQLLFNGSNIPKSNDGRFIITEFTGLKDTDDVDIYEEDIVYNDIDGHMYVVWEEGCYLLTNKEGDCVDSLYNYYKDRYLKVVGNRLKDASLVDKGAF